MNGILLLDKSEGWTSHDAVAKLRGLLHEKRIGHSGTLDPMATGLLVVFVGRATRAVQFAEADEKEYTAGIRFGLETDTLDTTGTVLTQSGQTPTREALEAVLPEFRGEIEQLPPMYSAIKIGGKKLCDIARTGREVERTPRRLTIHRLELLGGAGADYQLFVHCSKGTYIRSLCADIGSRLGCGAAMSSLRRTRAGAFHVEDAVTISEAAAIIEAGGAETLLRPVDGLFADCPALTVSGEKERKCRNGNQISVSAPNGRTRVYAESGEFLLLGRVENGILTTIKSFF